MYIDLRDNGYYENRFCLKYIFGILVYFFIFIIYVFGVCKKLKYRIVINY